MDQQIKKLADDAIALQNKDNMDATLREISRRCEPFGEHVEPLPPLDDEGLLRIQADVTYSVPALDDDAIMGVGIVEIDTPTPLPATRTTKPAKKGAKK